MKFYFEPCVQLFKKNELEQIEKRHQFCLGLKEGGAISSITNTVFHDAENLELVSMFELTSEKESAMDQVLANCNKAYDMASYKKLMSRSRSTRLKHLPTSRFDSSLQNRKKQ